jgi:hypothetical protein
MYVPVEQPATTIDGSLLDVAIVVVAVAAIGEVARNRGAGTDVDFDAAVMDLEEARLEVPLFPALGPASVAVPASVVVAGQEELAAAEFADERQRLGDPTHGNVAEHPHVIAVRDDLVPSLDERAVHRLDIGEWSSAVPDDVRVAEVEIGGEPRRHDHTSMAAHAGVRSREDLEALQDWRHEGIDRRSAV